MSYKFNFDLSELSRVLFKDIIEFSENGIENEKIENVAENFVKKFNIDKITGLSFDDSIQIMMDIIDIMLINKRNKDQFIKTNNRALFLPHCCRKFMDSRCKADFDSETSSYTCNHCSSDCIINHTTKFVKDQNYDIYILPGASCVEKIIHKYFYDGIIGIACTDELKLSIGFLEKSNIIVQCIPLLKNGCSGTTFNFEDLKRIMNDINITSNNKPIQ